MLRTYRNHVLLGCAIILTGLCTTGCGPQLSPNVELLADISYAQGYVDRSAKGETFAQTTLRLDILRPTDNPSPNKPAILMIHGGGFESGSRKDEDLVALADRFASEGYVCFLTDYRLKDDNPPAPADYSITPITAAVHASFVDANAALRFIQANHVQYEVNPDRVAVFGESAGGVAAFAMGLTQGTKFRQDRDDLVIPAGNNPDETLRPKAILDFWGSAFTVEEEFSPDDPPILIVHGDRDFTLFVSILDAQTVRRGAETNDIPHRYVPLSGEGHGAWDATVDGDDLGDIALDFLEEFV